MQGNDEGEGLKANGVNLCSGAIASTQARMRDEA